MPLRFLHHDLLQNYVQTLSSPLQSVIQPESIEKVPDYFSDIDKFETWAASNDASELTDHVSGSTQAQRKRTHIPGRGSEAPRLLICHDFKGGYTEDPFEQGYSFEFWQVHLVDTFIYFSHNRVTIPPRGWLDAGRRHGSKVLGTVIFEWAESKSDLRKCLYGEKLDSMQGLSSTEDDFTLSFSTRDASHLISLAQARDFDGYLINVETDLNFIPPMSSYPNQTQAEQDEDAAFLEQERRLAGLGTFISPDIQSRRTERMRKNVSALIGWVGWLRDQGKRRIGPHWEVIWYDSVTTAGKLEWQDALTPANVDFFVNSDGIFTNYTWARLPDPSLPGTFPETVSTQSKHHPALLQSAIMAKSVKRPACDIYAGIDVFGRNCYGGFAVGSSLEMIFPSLPSDHAKSSSENSSQLDFIPEEGKHDLGLSVALFAPAWTWEREKEGGGERTWDEWWKDELRFWFGNTAGGIPKQLVSVPPAIGTFFGPRERSILCTWPWLANSPPDSVVRFDTTDLHYQSRFVACTDTRSSRSAFYTNFNRGSGNSWWSRGHRVYDAILKTMDSVGGRGWTDIGSCFPKPDRIWPRPTLLLLEQGTMDVLKLSKFDGVVLQTTLIDYDVWEGGTALEIEIHPLEISGVKPAEGPSCIILPLCTLYQFHLMPGLCTLEIVVKNLSPLMKEPEVPKVDLRPCIVWATSKPRGQELYYTAQMVSSSTETVKWENGWYSTKVTAQLACPHTPIEVVPVFALEIAWPQLRAGSQGDTSTSLRLIVGAISSLTLPQISSTVSLSLHNTAPSPYQSAAMKLHKVTPQGSPDKLEWKPVSPPKNAPSGTLWGTLTWGPLDGEADITLGYYNIFASVSLPEETDVPESVWLGTSTYELKSNSFVVAGLEALYMISKRRRAILKEVEDYDSYPPSNLSRPKISVTSPGNEERSMFPAEIYFVVERVGYVDWLAGETTRYICKIEI